MVKTPAYPGESTEREIGRATERINEDRFQTGVRQRKDDLTNIAGVGPDLAKKLRRNGFRRVKKVARANPTELQQINGVGPAKADDLIDAATTESGADFEELTDLDGVGAGTARKLNDAGIRDPYELRGKTQQELTSIDGIGQKRAAKIRADVEFEAPARAESTGRLPETQSGTEIFKKTRDVNLANFNDILKTPEEDEYEGTQPTASNVFAKGPDRQEAISEHAERSEESRRADESFNAPIMLDEDTWARNKNEYDYPGVDTIPRSRKLERAREETAKATEIGAVGRIKADSEAAGNWKTAGSFSFGTVEVDTSFRRAEDTLAHEVGHAVDKELDRPSGMDARGNEVAGSIFDNPEAEQQAKELSAERRGRSLDTEYLDSRNEVFADLYAEATINPRRAKKKAPKAFRALQEAVKRDTGYF